MLFRLSKSFRFEAAHQLPHHDGKCARLHGHSWGLVVEVGARKLIGDGPKRGMVVDLGTLKDVVGPLVEDRLDHRYLNESTGLENPTSEELAYWIAQELSPKLRDAGAVLLAVEVSETCTSRCRLEWNVEGVNVEGCGGC